MIIYKTNAGKNALNVRDGSLKGRERQAIILANGQRSAEELALMLGEDGAHIVAGLVQKGHLSWAPTDMALDMGYEPGVVHRQLRPQSFYAYG